MFSLDLVTSLVNALLKIKVVDYIGSGCSPAVAEELHEMQMGVRLRSNGREL